jgi:hypothetical protein
MDNLAPMWLDTPSDDLLTDKAAGNADLLGVDHHHLLVIEQLLGDDRGKAAEYVVARVHHNALHAYAGAGHHRRRYPCPYVPTEAPGPTSGEERTRRWGHIPVLCWVDGLLPL